MLTLCGILNTTLFKWQLRWLLLELLQLLEKFELLFIQHLVTLLMNRIGPIVLGTNSDVSMQWLCLIVVKNGLTTASFCSFYLLFKQHFAEKLNWWNQQDSNSEPQSRRRARWPLGHTAALSLIGFLLGTKPQQVNYLILLNYFCKLNLKQGALR